MLRFLQKILVLIIASILIVSCSKDHPQADLVIRNGVIYTVNQQQPQAEAVAVVENKITFVGNDSEIDPWIGEDTQVLDLDGRIMTPGFIETHGHILGMGYNLIELDLNDVNSYAELVERVKESVSETERGEWILGRGWHQSKWDPQPDTLIKGFQTHHRLSAISPDNPVFLRHASGHAGFANAKAMQIAGVTPLSIESMKAELIDGGEIITDERGNPTGIFNELAKGLITRHIPDRTTESNRRALSTAIEECLRNGITGFHDAGAGREALSLFQQFKEEGDLGIRLYAMISGPNRELTEEWLENGPIIDTEDHLLTIRSIKLNCDGALGTRGAWLLEPYSDRPGHYGHETLPMDYVLEVSRKALQRGFQVCSHAIGDRANREVLDQYEKAFNEFPELARDHRFRIEHAQHLHPDDIPRFADLGVIAAMQAIHMSSDRPWAIDRLREKRIVEGAYVWQKLIKSGAKIINGTDVPVEPIDPLACFYASISRKTLKGTPEGGYEPSQRMTRDQALRSYTLDAAFGEFSEDVKGSIEVGKLADFTVFDRDIMKINERKILETNVDFTIFNGEIVFKRKN